MRGGKVGRTWKRKPAIRRAELPVPIYYKRDKGCLRAKEQGYTGGCLECPFVKCLEDSNVRRGRRKSLLQRAERTKQLQAEGKTQLEIMEILGIGRRTLRRYIKEMINKIEKEAEC